MKGNEKLIKALENIDVKELAEPRPIFSENVYKIFKEHGLTAEEVSTLENAEMLSQIVDLLPDDDKGNERLAAALEAVSKETTKENMQNLLLIAQKDPQMLAQLLALTEVIDPIQKEEK